MRPHAHHLHLANLRLMPGLGSASRLAAGRHAIMTEATEVHCRSDIYRARRAAVTMNASTPGSSSSPSTAPGK